MDLKFTPNPFSSWYNRTGDNAQPFKTIDNISNPSQTFDVDLTDPLVKVDVTILSQLNVAGGAVDPSNAPDRTLRQFRITAWYSRKNGGGDVYLIRPNTPLVYVYRAMQKLISAMNQHSLGGFMDASVINSEPFRYADVSGLGAEAAQPFAVNIPLYLGYLGGFGSGYLPGTMPDAKNGPFSQLKIKIDCVTPSGGAVSIQPDTPFPSSDRVYTYGAYPGYQSSQVMITLTKADPNRLSGKAAMGLFVPTFRLKRFTVTGGSVEPDGYFVTKWDRSQVIQSMMVFDEDFDPATGATISKGWATSRGTAMGTGTCLRELDFSVNSQTVSEYRMVTEALRQNTVGRMNNGGSNLAPLDCSPIQIFFPQLGDIEGMCDLRKYFAEDADVILNFYNVVDPGATNRIISILMCGYQFVQG